MVKLFHRNDFQLCLESVDAFSQKADGEGRSLPQALRLRMLAWHNAEGEGGSVCVGAGSPDKDDTIATGRRAAAELAVAEAALQAYADEADGTAGKNHQLVVNRLVQHINDLDDRLDAAVQLRAPSLTAPAASPLPSSDDDGGWDSLYAEEMKYGGEVYT